jgi:putative thioredoxin
MDELEKIRKRKIERLKEKMRNNNVKIKIEVNDNDFEERVIKQSKNVLVIVDFWAEWCMPCLMLGPILEKITEEHKGKVVLAKVNVDKNPKLSQLYQIDGIPSVKIFKNERLVDGFIGALPESQVKEYIQKHLKD